MPATAWCGEVVTYRKWRGTLWVAPNGQVLRMIPQTATRPAGWEPTGRWVKRPGAVK